ncbi:NB-ARC domains-containing protein [Tanacetum coccineum]
MLLSNMVSEGTVKILAVHATADPKHEVSVLSLYDAKPDVVRKQKRSYAQAFRNHEVSNSTEAGKWKKHYPGGLHLSGGSQDQYEYKFINCISKDILKILCDGPLHVGENLVGVDFHFDKLNLSRFVGSDKVNMIEYCVKKRLGKTTLSRAIYNLMYVHFDGSCFCEGVSKQQGATQVQMQMIGKIMKTENLKISSVAEGAMVIKQRMSCQRVLLVFDDVDDHEQLEAIAGSHTWFCPGSLIIFTAKDKQLLRSHRVDEIHDMDFLDEDRSLELFRSYAFKEKFSSTDFEEVSQKVVKYVQGHPLALKVLGRFLYGKTVGQWESELERLKVHPNEKIQRVLRLSYDGLDPYQKNILLDIACLFVDKQGFLASRAYRLLNGKRAIVREESIMTGKQRRLWNSSEVYNVLSEKKVPMTEAIEVVVLLLRRSSQKVHIDATGFAHLKKLRILKIYQIDKFLQEFELKNYNVKYSGSLYFLSNELRLFCWHGCPFKYLPSDFYPENIVAIDMSYSNIIQLWTTPKSFRRLMVMKLRYCCNLTTTPDFSEITNLEELDLEGCVNLVSVHPSIGMLKKLVVLNLRDCKRLQNFPSRVETGCQKVNQLPKADRTAITKLPSFVSSLINLESLSFGGQGRIQPRWWTSITAPIGLLSKQQHPPRSVSLAGLQMLKSLNLSYCNFVQIPESIGGLSCLENLDLEGNNFTSLPGSLSQLSHLSYLFVNGCKKLEVLPELPPSLKAIGASDCTSLRELLGSSKDPFSISNRHGGHFDNCPNLFKNITIDSGGSISKTECLDSSINSQGFIHQFSTFLEYLGFRTNRCEFFRTPGSASDFFNIIYHGNSMPEWFTNRSRANHVKVELPSDWCYDKNLKGYATCVVFKCKKPFNVYKGYSVKNFDGASLIRGRHFSHALEESFKKEVIGDMIWLRYERYIGGWEEVKNFVTFDFEENNEDVEVKECGLRLICNEDIQKERDLSMLQGLPTPTEHGGMLSLCYGERGYLSWSW